jgi:hypothetical protein
MRCEPEKKLDLTQMKCSIDLSKFETKFLRCRMIEELLKKHSWTRAQLARVFDVHRSTIGRDISDLSVLVPIQEDDSGRLYVDCD